MSASPSVSLSVSSLMAIFTSGGPPRNTAAALTNTVYSLIPGRYAPPAVELPNTREMVGMPEADSRVSSQGTPAADEDVCLAGQVGAAGLDQGDDRKPVAFGDVQRPPLFGDRRRAHRPPFHRRLISDDHAFDAADRAASGAQPSTRLFALAARARVGRQ